MPITFYGSFSSLRTVRDAVWAKEIGEPLSFVFHVWCISTDALLWGALSSIDEDGCTPSQYLSVDCCQGQTVQGYAAVQNLLEWALHRQSVWSATRKAVRIVALGVWRAKEP